MGPYKRIQVRALCIVRLWYLEALGELRNWSIVRALGLSLGVEGAARAAK